MFDERGEALYRSGRATLIQSALEVTCLLTHHYYKVLALDSHTPPPYGCMNETHLDLASIFPTYDSS